MENYDLLKAESEIDYIDRRIEEIEDKKSKLSEEKKELINKKNALLEQFCKWINKKKGKCDYDNTPLNKEGYYCSDCISAGYDHIKIKKT